MIRNESIVYNHSSPVGVISIEADSFYLKRVSFSRLSCPGHSTNEIILETISQLDRYFAKERKFFDLPLDRSLGTFFQRQVWQAMSQVGYGETKSYRELAEMIRKPQACRAVGNACGQNRFPIIIPCHRIIRSDGSLGGFSGNLSIKKKLLELESCV